jgi:hypothetical protein
MGGIFSLQPNPATSYVGKKQPKEYLLLVYFRMCPTNR